MLLTFCIFRFKPFFMNYEHHFNESAKSRNAFWSEIGTVRQDVITHLINPTFMGGPSWPSLRQAFIMVDTDEGTIIATDGLTDPYSDFDSNPENQTYNGIGCEFFIECDEQLKSFEDVKNSWQFSILYQVAQLAAGKPDILNLFEDYGCISTELYDCSVPKEFINKEERCGVLLGLESPGIPTEIQLSLEEVLTINIKLLTLQELAYINQKGVDGRNEIANLILKQPKAGKSFLSRTSVV